MKKIFRKQNLPHLIFGLIILILVIVAVVKLAVWNKGTSFVVKETTEDLTTETEDYYAAMDPSVFEGRTDDGVTTIVMLGDDILSSYRGDDGVAALVSTGANATIYNCSFEGSSLACSTSALDIDNHPMDAFSAYRLATCIASNDYYLLDWALDTMPDPKPYFSDTIELLKGIDFNTVDIIMLNFGVNDYLNGYMMSNFANTEDVASVTGSLRYTIDAIQSKYPHIRIIVNSPSFCYFQEADGSLVGSDIRKNGSEEFASVGSLGDYMIAMKNICVEKTITFIDNYYGVKINSETADQYLEGNVIPNAAGRQLIADHIIDVLNNYLY